MLRSSDDLENRNEREHHRGVFRTDRPRIRGLEAGQKLKPFRHDQYERSGTMIDQQITAAFTAALSKWVTAAALHL
ncbi:MAG: hypothetical protein WBW99_16860, partial [Pseudolabrys sp.]